MSYTFRSRGRSKPITFRLSGDVYDVLRRLVPNVSLFLRKLVIDAVERYCWKEFDEELRLEMEVACLTAELDRVHGWQKAVLKHGSYAEAYLKALKGGVVSDRQPYYQAKPHVDIKPEEKQLVETLVAYREALAHQLTCKLKRLMEIRKAKQLNP